MAFTSILGSSPRVLSSEQRLWPTPTPTHVPRNPLDIAHIVQIWILTEPVFIIPAKVNLAHFGQILLWAALSGGEVG